MASKRGLISLIFLLLISVASAENEYKITYTINVNDEGTAIWNVEYRTSLLTQDDLAAFENYTEQLKPVYLKEFKELMQNSVSAASNATSRKMLAGGFTGEARIENAPTGNYGVVLYSFTWTDFAKLDREKNIIIGDVFVGGLYLSKDNTLIIQYPSGYTVAQVIPQPDHDRDGMIWYGLRSFNAGEPVIQLKPPFSWMPYAIAILIAAIAGAMILRNRRKDQVIETISKVEIETTEETHPEPGTDLMDLEGRIETLLKEEGGTLYQSDIVKKLNLPKSTVSSALNGLHARKIIQKIKKGRENLIRLTPLSEHI
jgi:uncharacterized membrane protein